MTDILYSRAVSTLFVAGPKEEESAELTDLLTGGVKLAFSWVVLMPISVIVSGKLITQLLKIPGQRGQLFQIKIPPLISLRAQNDEVILGFALFIATLTVTGFFAGQAVYRAFSAGFGVDPGHFNTLCISSSFISVILSGFIFVVTRVSGFLQRKLDPVLREYDMTIDNLANQMPHFGQTDQAPTDGTPAESEEKVK